MNGEIKNDRTKLDTRLDRFQLWLEIAGGLVMLGLILEYGPEIWSAIIDRRIPSRDAIGGLLITIGVGGEVILGILIARDANRVQELANSDIAKALERAGVAEKEAANADLARVKLEQRLRRLTVTRTLDKNEVKGLQERLKPFAGQKFGISVGSTDDAATMEPDLFGFEIRQALHGAGWIEENTQVAPRVGKGVLIECDGGSMGAAIALSTALGSLGIEAKASELDKEQFRPLRIHVGLL